MFRGELTVDMQVGGALQRAHDELEIRMRQAMAEIVRLSNALQAVTNDRATAQAQLQVAIEAAPNGILIIDQNGTIRVVNAQIKQQFQYQRSELLGASIDLLLPERFRSRHAAQRKKFFVSPNLGIGNVANEFYGLRKDGAEFPIEISLDPIDAPGGKDLLVTIIDVTERKRIESELKRTAFHDILTGLPNRTLLLDNLLRLEAMSKRHGYYPFALLFLDLDRFKVINDSLGHMAGDQLLIEMAQRLLECTREEDTVARLGGDEFAILLEQIRGPEDAVRVAERVLKRLAEPLTLDDDEVSVSASIGIALSLSGEKQAENLLRDADMAMYQAKARRSGYQMFDRKMHLRALERMNLEIDLKRAIERNQIDVHYQPIVSLATGKIAGFEALARWQQQRVRCCG